MSIYAGDWYDLLNVNMRKFETRYDQQKNPNSLKYYRDHTVF